MILIKLYSEFFKAGLLAIGGGLATLPFLQEIGQETGWFNASDLANMIAVSESTPGAMGINMATYVGFTSSTGFPLSNIIGGIIATLGLITPSIIIILIIAAFLKSFRNNKYVNSAFYGLRPASTGLIASAGLSVLFLTIINQTALSQNGFSFGIIDWKSIILLAVLFVLTRYVPKIKKLHPIFFIAFSAVIGIIFKFNAM